MLGGEEDAMPNLGKALSIIWVQRAREHALDMDIVAFGAPSECHDLVAKGETGRRRQARRHAEAVAGMPYRRIMREAKRRTEGHALHRAEERVIGDWLARHAPWA
jgi:hypothetical protein